MHHLRNLAVALVALGAACWPASAQQRQVVVVNGADVAIEFVYFARCGAEDWGKDQLGAKEIIRPGARRVFKVTDSGGSDRNCCYDMRAKLQTGASRQKTSVDFCREVEWTVR